MGQRQGACQDFTCTNPLHAATVARCAEEGGYAAEQANNHKLAAYAVRVEAEGLVYLPLAVAPTGSGGCHQPSGPYCRPGVRGAGVPPASEVGGHSGER